LQGFYNEEVSKPIVPDVLCAMRSSANINEDNIEE
jgi:hypothetical protein